MVERHMARKGRSEFVSHVTAKPATRNHESHLIQVRVIPFEEEFYDVINNPQLIWDRYLEKMIRIVNKLANWKNFNKEDLFQQSYLYFIYFSEQYDPFWNGKFIPFDKYLFKNMIIKLRAFIQRFYVKSKRERPIEVINATAASEENTDNEEQISYDIEYANSQIYSDFIYSKISHRQRQIIDLTLQGYKQQEIGKILDISQSRVSVIKKRTLAKLQRLIQNNGIDPEENFDEFEKPKRTRMEF